jgi:uncharacterized repeat protein (TIGR04138 family)
MSAMPDPSHPIAKLLKEDCRYPLEAYVFVCQGLDYAHKILRMGTDADSQTAAGIEDVAEQAGAARHVTGQELCEALRRYALQQYGYMAKTVLNTWGIHRTGDFGEIVFNLIRVGQMRKTPSDARSDFEDIYDFDTALKMEFKISPSEPET